MQDQPFVSVIIPCRDERPWIDRCIESVLGTEWPADRMEVLCVDGRSADGTRDRLEARAKADPRVRLLDNPSRTTPHALNIGVAAARGAVILRLDAHAEYPVSYISRAVQALHETGAGNVGGVLEIRPQDSGRFAQAVVAAMADPAGAGDARYRIGVAARRDVDTVPFGCFAREVFDAVGGFDERLHRNQDYELNCRLRRSGRRVVLDPAIRAVYYARATPGRLFRHYVVNAWWVFRPLGWGVVAIAPRHWAPAGAAGIFAASWAFGAGAALGVAYVVLLGAASVRLAVRHRRLALIPWGSGALALMHVGFALGSLAGLVVAVAAWFSGGWRTPREGSRAP